MEKLDLLDAHLDRWSVPTEVRTLLQSAMAVADEEGIRLSAGGTDDYASLAARGKPVAVHVGRTRLSIALDPESAEQVHRADTSFGLERDSGVTSFIHCSYGSLSAPGKVPVVHQLVTEAFRRSARNTRDAAPAHREERRRAAAEATLERYRVPGCNLPMVGGSCVFHD